MNGGGKPPFFVVSEPILCGKMKNTPFEPCIIGSTGRMVIHNF